MTPEYVQKTLNLLGETEFSISDVEAGPPPDIEHGTLYEIFKGGRIYQILIWDKGVHEFMVGNSGDLTFYQCDLGLEKDYQVFEDFIKLNT